ncbi:hypothetical protein chiPu_0011654 [Chiloscyllium punctatum]|uniref:Ig-like domain-containing protein n=1 Tax=Chiloscyllium punctatum TaxID=137246 RepID=A0A401SS31_CHIPU|nr:hypothetical protein [Chiloscyllium punctatum]
MSEASSHDVYFDSLTDLQEDGEDGSPPPAELSAFLSQEEMCKSLDLARVAIAESSSEETEPEPEMEDISRYIRHRPLASLLEDSPPAGSQTAPRSGSPATPVKRNAESGSSTPKIDQGTDGSHIHQPTSPAHRAASPTHQPTSPVHRAASPTHQPTSPAHRATSPTHQPTSAAHQVTSPGQPDIPGTDSSSEDLELQPPTNPKEANPTPSSKRKGIPIYQSESSARNEFCTKAVSFIEELSSIFRTARPRNYGQGKCKSHEEDSSSPDSGYLSPKNHLKVSTTSTRKAAPLETKLAARPDLDAHAEVERSREPDTLPKGEEKVLTGSAPRFVQKLRSQEVAEGSTVRLECRLLGHPCPTVRYV